MSGVILSLVAVLVSVLVFLAARKLIRNIEDREKAEEDR